MPLHQEKGERLAVWQLISLRECFYQHRHFQEVSFSPCCSFLGITTKLTGGNGAQRNCRPVQRLVSAYFHSLLRGARPNLLEVPLTGLLSDTQAPSPLLLIFLSNTDPPIFVLASQ